MTFAFFITIPILLASALFVRFSGARIINFVDYSRVGDPAALHAWVGNRMLGLALVTACLAAASLLFSRLSVAFFVLSMIVLLGTVLWVAAGSGRFQSFKPTCSARLDPTNGPRP